MIKSIILLSFLIANASFSKTLTVNCEATDGQSVHLLAELIHIDQPIKVIEFAVNTEEPAKVIDRSMFPYYNSGLISLALNFAWGESSKAFNLVQLKLNKCDDSFENTGTGVLEEYVGGFAGSVRKSLKCTCSLKESN